MNAEAFHLGDSLSPKNPDYVQHAVIFFIPAVELDTFDSDYVQKTIEFISKATLVATYNNFQRDLSKAKDFFFSL